MITEFALFALDGLLVATLIYLTVLMRRLKDFQNYKKDMRSIVDDVIMSTEAAREAVARLKSSVIESRAEMAQQFEEAKRIEAALAVNVNEARRAMSMLDGGGRATKEKTTSAQNFEQSATHKKQSHSALSGKLNDVLDMGRDAAAHMNRPSRDPMSGSSSLARSSVALTERQDDDIERRLASLSQAVFNLRTKVATQP